LVPIKVHYMEKNPGMFVGLFINIMSLIGPDATTCFEKSLMFSANEPNYNYLTP